MNNLYTFTLRFFDIKEEKKKNAFRQFITFMKSLRNNGFVISVILKWSFGKMIILENVFRKTYVGVIYIYILYEIFTHIIRGPFSLLFRDTAAPRSSTLVYHDAPL